MNPQASSKTITAILGGAFDPIHNDHLNLALEVVDSGLAQEVWFVPSPNRWDKSTLAPVEHRLKMLELALVDYPQFSLVSDEIHTPIFCGTTVLLQNFQKSYPEREFRLLTGADTYGGIPLWKDQTAPKDEQINGITLLKNFSLIVVPRLGYELPDSQQHHALGYQPLYIINPVQTLGRVGNASSSYIRALQSPLELREWVSKSVAEYILNNHLYNF
jgi:nicotinate-nucleotide adenylyltransferase